MQRLDALWRREKQQGQHQAETDTVVPAIRAGLEARGATSPDFIIAERAAAKGTGDIFPAQVFASIFGVVGVFGNIITKRLRVHSETLPLISSRPYGLTPPGNAPTGEVPPMPGAS